MQEKSFSQILREKVAQTNPSSALSASEPTSFYQRPIPADHLSFLMGNIETLKRHGKYKEKPPSQKIRIKSQPHLFTENQKQAYDWFLLQKEKLEDDFNSMELRTVYRKLALKLHPDTSQSQSHSAFVELRANYKCLQQLFDGK